ncbi:hypothetical protein AXG89_12755 [Burkholderia sp. PAMC 26561]|nr:DUF1501 domain-containing protein [Burkholderia sp. PAMC 26561]AME24598.1 hypothetical protein AXG89_12755 [Burkholderia sp. PAMC 26561]
MNRRDFLSVACALGVCAMAPSTIAVARQVQPAAQGMVLILVELKGGDDGLNTVIPFADPAYADLRPTIGIHRDHVLQLDERSGLHPAMQPLMPLWRDGQLAIVQGIGYPQQNLSHFRSMEIWDTASHADQYLRDGWLARAFGAGGFETTLPADPIGTSIKTAMEALASTRALSVIRLTLNGFDTHQNQPIQHARLLGQLSNGLAAVRSALTELGRWNDTLVMTYSEFGRCPRENDSRGTDHGTAAPHFLLGGRVNGGLYGAAPALSRLDGNGNLPMNVDFRQLYATVLGSWRGMNADAVLGGKFETLPIMRA